jgi:hypothetical protein
LYKGATNTENKRKLANIIGNQWTIENAKALEKNIKKEIENRKEYYNKLVKGKSKGLGLKTGALQAAKNLYNGKKPMTNAEMTRLMNRIFTNKEYLESTYAQKPHPPPHGAPRAKGAPKYARRLKVQPGVPNVKPGVPTVNLSNVRKDLRPENSNTGSARSASTTASQAARRQRNLVKEIERETGGQRL